MSLRQKPSPPNTCCHFTASNESFISPISPSIVNTFNEGRVQNFGLRT
jgi:hypothetical protein